MAAVTIDPMKLPGPWVDGYVRERQHTLTSDFLGHDSFGTAVRHKTLSRYARDIVVLIAQGIRLSNDTESGLSRRATLRTPLATPSTEFAR